MKTINSKPLNHTYTKVPTRATIPLAAPNAGIDAVAACTAIAKLCKFTRTSQRNKYRETQEFQHTLKQLYQYIY